MKKTIYVFGIMLLMLTVLVAAEGRETIISDPDKRPEVNSTCKALPSGVRNACCVKIGFAEFDTERERCVLTPTLEEEDVIIRIKSNVTGLENAIIRVRNNETAIHLQAVMKKIEAKRLQKIKMLENLTFDVDENGDAFAEGKAKAKLLAAFTLRHRYNCHVFEDGSTARKPRPFDFVWKDINSDVCGEKVV